MRALLAVATLLLACSAAQAQYTIEYGGRTIHIDPDRGTVSIPGVYDNTGKKGKRARTDQKQAPAPQQQQQTTVDPRPAPSQAANPPVQPSQAAAPAVQTPPPVNGSPAAPAVTANNAPAAETIVQPQPPAPAPLPVQQNVAPIATPQQPPPPPAPSVAAVPPAPAAPAAAPVARPQVPAPTVAAVPPTPAPAATLRDPSSPVGIWLTEEKEGQVRIEPCGANLCGYSVDSKSNGNGEQILINMKPGKDQKWSGRIHDPNTGSDYDSTIALKSPDELRVQGCAFGGMFCGGQTWTRVN